MKKAAVIILNWNGFDDTCECVESVLASSYRNFQVVIVDNNSDNSEGERLRKKFDQNDKVTVIKNNSNSGYCGGNNIGFRHVCSHNYDYAIILNNDTVIDKSLISSLVEESEDKSLAAVGATITNYNDDLIQNQGINFSIYTGISRAENKNKKYKIGLKNSANCFSGACFLIKTNVKIDKLFDEDFFCYFEEIDLCLRLKALGCKIGISEKAIVKHKGYASAKKISGFSERQLAKNRFLVVKKNGTFFQKIIFLSSNLFVYLPLRFLIFKRDKSNNYKYFIAGFKEGLARFFRRSRTDLIFIRANSFDSEPRLIKVYNSLKEDYTCKLLLWKLDKTACPRENIIYFNLSLPYGSVWLKPAYFLWFSHTFFDLIKLNPKSIHACDMEAFLIAYCYKLFFRNTKIVYDIYDVTADKYNFPYSSTKRKILIALEKFLVYRTNYLIIPDEERIDELGIDKKRIDYKVIYNSTASDEGGLKRVKLSKDKDIELLYVGILSKKVRGIEFLINLAKEFKNLNIKIAGFGVDQQYFSKKIKSLKLNNLHFLGRVDFDVAQSLNRQTDIMVSLLDPSFNNYKYATSTKVFDAFSAMKPIITTKNTASGNLVNMTGWGAVIDYNYDSLRKTIEEMISGKITFTLDSSKVIKYSWRSCEEGLKAIYKEIINDK